MSQLISVILASGLDGACEDLTRLGLADYLVQLIPHPIAAESTTVVLRVPDEHAPRVRATLGWPNPANLAPYDLGVDKRWVPPRWR